MPNMRTVTHKADPETIVTTTTRQVVPADAGTPERRMPEFWTYVEALKPEDWERHVVYIYRMEPRATTYGEGTSAIEKIVGGIEMRPGVSVPFTNREDVELAIREKHGGKAFRLIIKRGSERVSEGKVSNELPPRYPTPTLENANQGATVMVSNENATADIAKTAMTTIAGQEREGMSVAVSALRSAADVVARFSTQQAVPAASATDDLFKQAMLLMMQRALNPPDPFELISRLLPLFRSSGNEGGEGSRGGAIDRIMDTAVERLINPTALAGPVASAGAELVRQLPQVAGYVAQSISQWRAGMEAQRDTASIMAGRPPVQQPPTQQPPHPPAASLPPGTPPQPDQGGFVGPSLEFIEDKIIEIFKEGHSAEDTADDVLTFLDRMDPQLVAQLRMLGENGLLGVFQTRPRLQPALQNMPRLTEFIRAFLRLASPPETNIPIVEDEPPKVN